MCGSRWPFSLLMKSVESLEISGVWPATANQIVPEMLTQRGSVVAWSAPDSNFERHLCVLHLNSAPQRCAMEMPKQYFIECDYRGTFVSGVTFYFVWKVLIIHFIVYFVKDNRLISPFIFRLRLIIHDLYFPPQKNKNPATCVEHVKLVRIKCKNLIGI